MTEPIQKSADVLCEEILVDARRVVGETIRAANKEAAEIIAGAEADAMAARKNQLDQATAEAARRSEMLLATVPVEVGRMKSEKMESLLESVHDEIRRRLTFEPFASREIIIALAAEAIARMSGDDFILNVSITDRAALGDAALAEIEGRAARSGLRIRIEESAGVEAGVIVQDAEGRQIWDNRLVVRLERMWPEMRRQIAVQSGIVSGAAR